MRPAGWLCLFLGCGVTQETRRTFPVEVVVRQAEGSFDTGWSVSEVAGALELTELRFFEGEGLSRGFWPAQLVVSTAAAHPGHFAPGEAKAEVLTPLRVDLSARGVVPWSEANAVTGDLGSAQLSFGAAGARVTGVATRGGRRLRFDTGAKTFAGPLSGLPFVHQLTREPGAVRLTVDLEPVLSRIDFDRHESSADGGVITFAPTSRAFNGVDRGFTDAATFRFTWQSHQ